MRDCYRAVETRLHQILPSIDDADDEVAEAAVALVSAFPRAAEVVAPRLRSVGGDRPIVAGMALLGLARLGEAPSAEASRLVLTVEGPGRVYAAFGALLGQEDRSAAVYVPIFSVPEAWTTRRCPFAESLGKLVNRAWSLLPPEAADAAIVQLGGALERARGLEKVDPLTALLRVARVKGTNNLEPRARIAIALVVEHGDWGPYHNVCQAQILRAHGLPEDREALRRLL